MFSLVPSSVLAQISEQAAQESLYDGDGSVDAQDLSGGNFDDAFEKGTHEGGTQFARALMMEIDAPTTDWSNAAWFTPIQRNVIDVLQRMINAAANSPSDADVYAAELDDMLDNLRDNDFFGTEGADDPRGDFRAGDWALTDSISRPQ